MSSAAVPPAVATPHGTFTFALPSGFAVDRAEHAASRSIAARPVRRATARAVVRHRAVARHRVGTYRIRHHAAVRHRPARAGRTAPAGSGRLGIAYAYARAQIGDPYVYGAARPGAWDCSGLTSAAYARIGIRLPHRAAEQAHRGVAVPRSRARVGDLVVWGTHHVGLYAGHGRVLHAPRPGKSVQIAAIWGSPTYRRVTHG